MKLIKKRIELLLILRSVDYKLYIYPQRRDTMSEVC